MYEEEKDDEIPPPVLVPCYKNRGLNKVQQLLIWLSDQQNLINSMFASERQSQANGGKPEQDQRTKQIAKQIS